VFNPAVAAGISVLRLSSWSNLWIYLLAEFVGATAAAGAFNAINRDEDAPVSKSTDQRQEQKAVA
jgi:aquaporin Z